MGRRMNVYKKFSLCGSSSNPFGSLPQQTPGFLSNQSVTNASVMHQIYVIPDRHVPPPDVVNHIQQKVIHPLFDGVTNSKLNVIVISSQVNKKLGPRTPGYYRGYWGRHLEP